MAGGIQGTVADACLWILAHHNIKPVVKWVDDFIFFQEPALLPSSQPNPNNASPFQYNLSMSLRLQTPWVYLGTIFQRRAKTSCPISAILVSIGTLLQNRCQFPKTNVSEPSKSSPLSSMPTPSTYETSHPSSAPCSTSPLFTETVATPSPASPCSCQNSQTSLSNITFRHKHDTILPGGETSF